MNDRKRVKATKKKPKLIQKFRRIEQKMIKNQQRTNVKKERKKERKKDTLVKKEKMK